MICGEGFIVMGLEDVSMGACRESQATATVS